MHSLVVRNMTLSAGQLSLDVPQMQFTQGRTCCVIGRSGSGKSLFAAALSGLPVPDLKVSGDILLDHQPAAGPLWRDHVFVLPQEPAAALDPTMPVRKQLAQILRWRRDPRCPWASTEDLFAQVGLKPADGLKFPGQLSGGMQQRVMIAMALAARASFVIADEPTKGLDQTSKLRTIELFKLLKQTGRGLVIITHDLNVARDLADDLVIFEQGKIAEQGDAAQILNGSGSQAAQAMIKSEPQMWPEKCIRTENNAASVLSIQDVTFEFAKGAPVVNGATLDIREGEVVGLLGPSGVGKSTLADICLGLLKPSSGSVRWLGETADRKLIRAERTKFQKLFQNPASAFPPNIILGDVFDKLTPASGTGFYSKSALMAKLNLDPSVLLRRPDQLSGGELQRLLIVRVLLAQPRFLVCDEPSSRLDMSIQRLAIDIIADYAAQTLAAVLLISHDKTVLQKRADRFFEFTNSGLLEQRASTF
ncbi:ATP-binding cassette domain-containing protein [Phaeobacter inhibens]|nr:ATP-binding cassette domain-containing protein [Phaeobacter inhibens]